MTVGGGVTYWPAARLGLRLDTFRFLPVATDDTIPRRRTFSVSVLGCAGGRLHVAFAEIAQRRCSHLKAADPSAGDPMSRPSCYLLVGFTFALHNGEEALTARSLLRFMQSDAPGFLRDFYAGITVFELQANLLILTVLGFVVTAVAVRFSTISASAFGMMVFAALLGLNALLHIGLSIASRSYMPGLVTAVLITLPVSVLLLLRAQHEAWVSTSAFWAVMPVAAVIHGPVLGTFLRTSLLLMRE